MPPSGADCYPPFDEADNARMTLASKPIRFTFRGNVEETRHGWIRLTPAYSVHLVRELLEDVRPLDGTVLDPFCGTGTTLLSCAERGLGATTIDVNPFLLWLTRAKAAPYDDASIAEATRLIDGMTRAAAAESGEVFTPPIHRIERWWGKRTLAALGRAAAVARRERDRASRRANDLAALALCRSLISVANVSFGHQSMSFRAADQKRTDSRTGVAREIRRSFELLVRTAILALPRSKHRVLLGDSRHLDRLLAKDSCGLVVTSPPYPNRMSYIRELRPYMYWLEYLVDRRDAGELDWTAIGGTWGAATSRLATWEPKPDVHVPFPGFDRIVQKIRKHEPILASYVHRYFEDMLQHTQSLGRVVSPGGRLSYVVGNSKFYDVLLPVQDIFAALFEASGFDETKITVLRKRTSKRELYEYLVEAKKPP